MIVGFCGNLQRPSRSRSLVEEVADRLALQHRSDVKIFDVVDLLPDLCSTIGTTLPIKVASTIQAIREADVLIVGTPVYKGSYTGLFKHVFDLIAPDALAAKPVIITATGGGDKHALVVEHQLRPLFGFFTAHCSPTAIYASDREFVDYKLQSEAVSSRIDQAISALMPVIAAPRKT